MVMIEAEMLGHEEARNTTGLPDHPTDNAVEVLDDTSTGIECGGISSKVCLMLDIMTLAVIQVADQK
jgi:hypothetical protein